MKPTLNINPTLNKASKAVEEQTTKKLTFSNANLWYILKQTKTAATSRSTRALSIY